MESAIPDLRSLTASAVLLKGGHLEGDEMLDLLITNKSEERFSGQRFTSRHTHGTGCTLASAIACGLAQGLTLSEATRRARDYVLKAIQTAPGFGQGHGPLNHAHTVVTF
jgi:hydroxymethylpyrimidine/phosphomethylpyrimidine kinase